MNVFDFDGTIYDGDSSVDFCLFCLRRHPRLVRYLPRIGNAALEYRLGRISKTQMKEQFFSFLASLENWEMEVAAFWDTHEVRIFPWYRAVGRPNDLIISASPAFLLGEICSRLGLQPPIASLVNPETGVFSGENCRDIEKVRRFRQIYGDTRIENFYTDSVTADAPLAVLADNAWLIRKGQPVRHDFPLHPTGVTTENR